MPDRADERAARTKGRNGAGRRTKRASARAKKLNGNGTSRAEPRRNGKAAARPAGLDPFELQPPPWDEPRGPLGPPRGHRGGESETHMRFRFASLVRLSDNLVGKAVRAYDSLFDIEPEQKAEIYLDMGREFVKAGKMPEALSSLRKAVQIRPDLSVAWLELGRVYLRREALDAAEQAFQRAKEHGEATPRLHSLMAEVLVSQGRDQEALKELERCALLAPEEPRNWYRLGVLNDRLGRYAEAIEAFEQAIELAPTEAAYHQGLGFTLESMGHRKEAIRCFKQALALEQGGLL